MKTMIDKCSLILRLGVTATVLLLSQHVLAAGADTNYGTNVDNLATVNYSVGGSPQELIESAPPDLGGNGNSIPGLTNGTVTTFEVDLRVDFTLAEIDGLHTDVAIGDTDAFVAFTLTNTSNGPLDFNLLSTQLSAPGTVHLIDDTDVDMAAVRVRVANTDGAGGVPDLADKDYVDELGEDETVVIYIFANAIGVFVNDDYANFDLLATAAEAGLLDTEGAAHVDDVGVADDPAVVDVVFAITQIGAGLTVGFLNAQDGFHLISAILEITKDATVIFDPFNGAIGPGVFPKAIPGAIIEYVITVDNTVGTEDADNVVITDTIDGDVTLNLNVAAYGGDDVWIRTDDNTVIVTPCNADALDADADGCALDVDDLTIAGAPAIPLGITVDAGTFATFTYQVTIP